MIECPCQGERPANLPDEEAGDFVGPGTANGTPIATNNEVFPWNDVRLPPWIRPVRYELRIHPNLTTLEVKGQHSFTLIPWGREILVALFSLLCRFSN